MAVIEIVDRNREARKVDKPKNVEKEKKEEDKKKDQKVASK